MVGQKSWDKIPNVPGKLCFHLRLFVSWQDYAKTTRPISMTLCGGVGQNPMSHWVLVWIQIRGRSRNIFSLSVTLCVENHFVFNWLVWFMDLGERNPARLRVWDLWAIWCRSNRNLDLVSLNVVSLEAWAEVWTLLSAILVDSNSKFKRENIFLQCQAKE